MLLTTRQRRRRDAAMKWGFLLAMVMLLLTPKMDSGLPDVWIPFVTAAVAAE